MKKKLWFLLLGIRPRTLPLCLFPIFLGSLISFILFHQFDIFIAFFSSLTALFLQIGTNLINDVCDFQKGADTQERKGPLRITQHRLLSEKEVYRAGIFSFFCAFIFGLPLVILGGKIIAVFGVASLCVGYFYTAGPFPLGYHGWGDLFVFLFFGLIGVLGTVFLHTSFFPLSAWLGGIQCGFFATLPIAINHLRDEKTDRLAQKKTLTVRYGPVFVIKQITISSLLPFFLGWGWWSLGFPKACFYPFMMIPWTFVFLKKIWNFNAENHTVMLLDSIILYLGFVITFALGLTLS